MLIHIAALVDEFFIDLGAVIDDPGPGLPRTLRCPNGMVLPFHPRCRCDLCPPLGATPPPPRTRRGDPQ